MKDLLEIKKWTNIWEGYYRFILRRVKHYKTRLKQLERLKIDDNENRAKIIALKNLIYDHENTKNHISK